MQYLLYVVFSTSMCTPFATYIVYNINNAQKKEQKEETMKERVPINKVKLAIGLAIAFGAMYGTEKLLANLNKEEPTSSSYQTTTEPSAENIVVEQPTDDATAVQGAKTDPKQPKPTTQSSNSGQSTPTTQGPAPAPQLVTPQPANNTNNQTTRNNTQNNTIVDQNNEDTPPTTEENEQSNNNQNNAQ